MNYTLEQLDMMEGHDFEYAVAELLRYNGWRDVEVTQGSGDYGIDILARRMNVKYAIQCKRHSKPVGNSAVQQAAAGTDYYHCDAAAVITNNTFTKPAENMAKTIGVRLWGREFLAQLINNYDSGYDEFYKQNQFAGRKTDSSDVSKIHPNAAIESKGWTQEDEDKYSRIRTSFILCLLLGFFGVHRFYNHKTASGILWLFTGGLFIIGWFIDLLNLTDAFSKLYSERKRLRNRHKN